MRLLGSLRSCRASVKGMSNLAARFLGGNEVHVVDPQVDLRHVFADPDALKENCKQRKIKCDVEKVAENYNEWWKKYEVYNRLKQGKDKVTLPLARKELRALSDGLLSALELPNTLTGVTQGDGDASLKEPVESKHAQYLARQGLVRLDREAEVVHLVGHIATMLNTLTGIFLGAFPTSILVSPPHMVRAAVVQACNVDAKVLSSFSDGSPSFPETFLTGHSLPSLVSMFLRAQFSSKTNDWPLCFHSCGMQYMAKSGRYDLISCRQRQKYTQLVLCRSEKELYLAVASAASVVEMVLRDILEMEFESVHLPARNLHNYEQCGKAFTIGGVEVARVSTIGEYISRRANLQTDTGFAHMGFVEVDLYRLLAKLVDNSLEGKDYPKVLAEAVKEKASN